MELHDYNSRRQMKLSDSFPEAADGALAEPAKVPGQLGWSCEGRRARRLSGRRVPRPS